MPLALLVLAVVGLAYANGANDNFKGVATLYGSGEMGYRRALVWATIATLAGSVVSLVLAGAIAQRFSGKGLLPAGLEQSVPALVSIAGAGAATVLLATRLGLPTSTTHALTGALLGVALAAGAGAEALAPLARLFVVPLLLGPLVAVALAWPAARLARPTSGGEACVCVTPGEPRTDGGALALAASSMPALVVAAPEVCERELGARGVVLSSRRLGYGLHVASAGTVCFARAVNDTPKIAALLLAAPNFGAPAALATTAAAMTLGGWLGSRRVAETMSRRITSIEASQGLLGNAVTSALVLAASPLGMPLSTTHVSCGAIFGIALARGTAERATVRHILLAWLGTLPLAAALAAALHSLAGA